MLTARDGAEQKRSPLVCAWRARTSVLVGLALVVAGCMVGPAYHEPTAPTAPHWLDAHTERVETAGQAPERWWTVFGDAALDTLVDTAYRQNLPLQAAGLRVVEAQARRGITIGALFPQTQEATGAYMRTRSSLSQPFVTPAIRDFNTYQIGFDAAWELDFWGRFRRAIEAADAELLASVADYDDVLVSLVAEVAATYVNVRVLEERLLLARENTRLQRDSLDIASVRYAAGGTSELDVQQATTLLEDTEADIPEVEIQWRQALDALSVLLGIPPSDLTETMESSSGIPLPPPSVAVGIPADLLERRPDVRRAERQLAAQSARIGVAESDLFPHIQLVGSVGLSAEQAAQLFEGHSFEGMGGPQFNWPILNYGRIINAVRVQDASFQESAAVYANTVLRAQQEVEDAVVGYVRGADEVMHLEHSVAAANRAVELSLVQYREGAADYTRVLNSEQSKITEDRRLTTNRGLVTISVIALYKALGGGWELREGKDFVPDDTRQEMRARTWWGGMLGTKAQTQDVHAATTGTEGDHSWGFLRWRQWWPHW